MADTPGAMRTRYFPLALLLVPMLGAAHGLAAAETNLAVRPLGGGEFEIGLVRLNKHERSVRFPAEVNMREQTVEYAVVHRTGKTHESVLRTEARPQDIHVAMLLLGAKPVMTRSFGPDGKALPLGESVRIEVSWTNAAGAVTRPIEDLVWNPEAKESLPRGDWIYNGSNFSEGAFTAQRDGSIISIHIDPEALVNNPRPGRENDDLHTPHAEKLPPLGTPVQVTMRLARHTNSVPATQ
jgi:hypothetical protein